MHGAQHAGQEGQHPQQLHAQRDPAGQHLDQRDAEAGQQADRVDGIEHVGLPEAVIERNAQPFDVHMAHRQRHVQVRRDGADDKHRHGQRAPRNPALLLEEDGVGAEHPEDDGEQQRHHPQAVEQQHGVVRQRGAQHQAEEGEEPPAQGRDGVVEIPVDPPVDEDHPGEIVGGEGEEDGGDGRAGQLGQMHRLAPPRRWRRSSVLFPETSSMRRNSLCCFLDIRHRPGCKAGNGTRPVSAYPFTASNARWHGKSDRGNRTSEIGPRKSDLGPGFWVLVPSPPDPITQVPVPRSQNPGPESPHNPARLQIANNN